jgi:DNA repair photolyase
VRVESLRVTALPAPSNHPQLPLVALDPSPQPQAPRWSELDRRQRGTRFIGIQARGVINSSATTHMTFWSINPYIGCEFGCRYCYARDTHRWSVERAVAADATSSAAGEVLSLEPTEAFERRILVKQNAADVLAHSLDPSRLDGEPLVIGTATDPYQPAERRFRITRSLLETLLKYRGLSLGIITKSPLITRDIDLLVALASTHQVTINLSIAAIDASLLRRLEPRSPTPQARLRAMDRLTAAGLHAGLLIAPVLPRINDGRAALLGLVRAARDCGAEWVAAAPLRMGAATRRTLLPWLDREHPDLARRYHAHYGSRQGVTPAYDAALQRRLARIRRDVGLTPRPGMRQAHDRRVALRHGVQLELWMTHRT